MASIVISGDTSGSITVSAPAVAGSNTLSLPAETGTLAPIVSGTAVTASGTSIDFTGIPSWVKRITVCYAGISLSGSSSYLVQIGTSGGIQTTGYLGASSYVGASVTGVNFTTGFGINQGSPGEIRSGIMTLALLNSSTGLWVASYVDGWSSQAYSGFGGGQKTLSGTLDRVRITTVNGTDTFDAGSVNILYE